MTEIKKKGSSPIELKAAGCKRLRLVSPASPPAGEFDTIRRESLMFSRLQPFVECIEFRHKRQQERRVKVFEELFVRYKHPPIAGNRPIMSIQW